jgi:proline iminopeptidase
MPGIDPAVLAEIQAFEAVEDYENPRYMELLIQHHYVYHVLRMPYEEWPDPVNRGFKHINPDIYIPMQGPSELGASGKLLEWDRTDDLEKIETVSLIIGAQHDTMNPDHMEWMARQMPNGRSLHCPNGSHMAFFDDHQHFFRGLVQFVKDLDAGRL